MMYPAAPHTTAVSRGATVTRQRHELADVAAVVEVVVVVVAIAVATFVIYQCTK